MREEVKEFTSKHVSYNTMKAPKLLFLHNTDHIRKVRKMNTTNCNQNISAKRKINGL